MSDLSFLLEVIFYIASLSNQTNFISYYRDEGVVTGFQNFLCLESSIIQYNPPCFFRWVELALHQITFGEPNNHRQIPDLSTIPEQLCKTTALAENLNSSDNISPLVLAQTIIRRFLTAFNFSDIIQDDYTSHTYAINFEESEHYDFGNTIGLFEYGMTLPIIALQVDKILQIMKRGLEEQGSSNTKPNTNPKPNSSEVLETRKRDWKSLARVQDVSQELFEADMRLDELENLIKSDSFVHLKLVCTPQTEPASNIIRSSEFLESVSIYSSFLQTLAAPMGRAGYTLRTAHARSDEVLEVPDFVLAVKAKSSKSLKTATNYQVSQELVLLGAFANGVASSLSITQHDLELLQPNWILLNKPKNLQSLTSGMIIGDEAHSEAVKAFNIALTTYSGIIFGLGLHSNINTPLKRMPAWRMIHYFDMKIDILTSSFLLGRACCFLGRGHDDTNTVELLQLHIPRLSEYTTQGYQTPTGLTTVSKSVQSIAILGLGLVFKGLADKNIASFLMSQICSASTNLPGEYDFQTNKDLCHYKSYVLNSGLSLGLICLGKGNRFTFMAGGCEKTLFDMLYPIIAHKGPHKPNSPGNLKNTSAMLKLASEPAALLALALCYINTNDEILTSFLSKALKDKKLVKKMSNDSLQIYTISRWLISINILKPSLGFILQNSLSRDLLDQLFDNFDGQILHHSKNTTEIPTPLQFKKQAQICVELKRIFLLEIAGICFVLALKYAGTHSANAKNVILSFLDTNLKDFISLDDLNEINDEPSYDTKQIRSLYNLVNSVLALCAAIVMAGSGDIDVMSRLRLLDNNISKYVHKNYLKYLVDNNPDILYEEYNLSSQFIYQSCFGYSIFIKTGLGILFLGGGNGKLSNDVESIALLVISLIPMISTFVDSSDGRNSLRPKQIDSFNNSSLALYMSKFLWALAARDRGSYNKTDNQHTSAEPNLASNTGMKLEKGNPLRNHINIRPLSNYQKVERGSDKLSLIKRISDQVNNSLNQYEDWLDFITKNFKLQTNEQKYKKLVNNGIQTFKPDNRTAHSLKIGAMFASYIIKQLSNTEYGSCLGDSMENFISSNLEANFSKNSDFNVKNERTKSYSMISRLLLASYKTISCCVVFKSDQAA